MVVKRGDVWRVALDSTGSRGARKVRRCVVVSPPELHDFLGTVIVAPLTTSAKPAPFRIALRIDGKAAMILLEQVRTLDKTRLVSRVGAVSPATLRASLLALQQTFAA